MDFELVTVADDDNPDVGDLKLTNGQITLTPDLATLVAQRVVIRLKFFLGEWFLDSRQGTPWFQRVFVKDPDEKDIERILRKIVIETPGVSSISAMEFVYDAEERSLSIPVLDIVCQDGTIVTAENLGAFIVEG